jgi:predicted transcriptional regulator
MYKVKEIAEILNVSDKSVRRYLNSYFSINDRAYEVSEKMLEILKKEYCGQPADNLRTGSDSPVREYERIEYFTEDEYQEFHKRLIEYPLLKETIEHVMNELDYHKKSAESHNRQMEIILNTMQQRNYIEAKDKKID